MTTDPGQQKIPENPLVQKLTVEGGQEAITFCGYIGPSSDEGLINLYRSLENLADSIEIARQDILHFEDVPETVLLFGAKMIWVKKDAKITFRRVETAEMARAVHAAPKDVTEVRKGRLRMLMRSQGREADCYTPCKMCASECTTCISTCQHTPPPPTTKDD